MQIIVYDKPRSVKVDEAPDIPIRENEVRIQTLFSGISHGTEMNVYRGVAPFFSRKNDPEVRLFRPAAEGERWKYPIRSCDPGVWYMGYANVGRVVEAGKNVRGVCVGDIVYSSSPHQSHVIKPENDIIKLQGNINPEYGIFLTNAMTALNGILDTHIKLGDTVVVSGLGVLGQLVLQMAKLNGAFKVFGIDLYEKRLEVALENGADKVFNPVECDDIAYEIRKLTGNKGADAVIEISGSPKALNEAIRIAAPDTTVTALGWYQGKCCDMNLSEEFHHNRIGIKSSQTNYVNPSISNTWDNSRRSETCIELLSRLRLDNIITHKIPYKDIAKAYEIVDKDPGKTVQVMIVY